MFLCDFCQEISVAVGDYGFLWWIQWQRNSKSLETKYKEVRDCNSRSGNSPLSICWLCHCWIFCLFFLINTTDIWNKCCHQQIFSNIWPAVAKMIRSVCLDQRHTGRYRSVPLESLKKENQYWVTWTVSCKSSRKESSCCSCSDWFYGKTLPQIQLICNKSWLLHLCLQAMSILLIPQIFMESPWKWFQEEW